MRYTSSRVFTFAMLLSSALGGCASVPALVPAGGQNRLFGSAAGATMTVLDSPWNGSPDDLGEHVTPVATQFDNQGPNAVRLSYYDLVLTDETGRRYAALNPFTAQAASSERDVDPVANGTLVAWRGRVRIGAPAPRMVPGRVYVGAPRPHAFFGRRAIIVGHGVRGFAVYPHYRRWFGPSALFWGNPFLWPPGYATWVWGWGPAYYPGAQPPADVLEEGLPEGVLQPGGHVSGYVYFQKIDERARRLTLTWEIHDANTGAPLGVAPVQLEVELQ